MNLISIEPIIEAVNKVTKIKGIDNEVITQWLVKAEKRFFESSGEMCRHELQNIVRKYNPAKGDEDWKKNAYVVVYDNGRIDFLLHVCDFLLTKDEKYLSKLYKKTPEDIYCNEIEVWDEQMANSGASVDKNQLVEGVDYKVIHVFENGHKIIGALTAKVCQYEGESMGHCAKNESYKVKPTSIISLWDRGNNPHVTMELSPPSSKTIVQIKGKQNRAPVEKYKQYIVDFIQSEKYKVTRDGENLGMVSFDNVYYFKNSEEFAKVYETEIIPRQNEAFEKIKKMIK